MMAIATTFAALVAQTAAKAEPVADFYRSKPISLYVGFPPGGGYDLYARVFAPHFSRHIPGNPPIVIKTMLGGSGIQAPVEGVLEGLEQHLYEWGLGSVSETADGDPPHAATGCPMQAWSVAELIRARSLVRRR